MATARETWPPHVLNLGQNLQEVRALVNLHTKQTGVGPGRRYGVEILNKSSLVFLVACWEAYVEDLAMHAFNFMLAGAMTPSTFPMRSLIGPSDPLRTSKDSREVWRLAGDGWKDVLIQHRITLLQEFHTPKTQQIDDLFARSLGMPDLSKTWHWKGMSSARSTAALDRLVRVRGDVAHRVTTAESVKKSLVTDSIELIQRLAAISSNRVGGFVEGRTRSRPWNKFRYRGTR